MSSDVSRSGNLRVSSLLGFDVRAGIKADGSDFYAINCKPHGLPINRTHSLNSPLLRLFSLRACALRVFVLTYVSSLQGDMNSENSKLPCFPLIFSKDYHCQVISRSKSIALSAFICRALMHKVQLVESSPSGKNHLLP